VSAEFASYGLNVILCVILVSIWGRLRHIEGELSAWRAFFGHAPPTAALATLHPPAYGSGPWPAMARTDPDAQQRSPSQPNPWSTPR
jgi:hypothetical protein